MRTAVAVQMAALILSAAAWAALHSDSLQVGQKGMIRLVALNQRTPPVLEGSVFYISADAIRDTAAAPASRNADVARIALSADEVARALSVQ